MVTRKSEAVTPLLLFCLLTLCDPASSSPPLTLTSSFALKRPSVDTLFFHEQDPKTLKRLNMCNEKVRQHFPSSFVVKAAEQNCKDETCTDCLSKTDTKNFKELQTSFLHEEQVEGGEVRSLNKTLTRVLAMSHALTSPFFLVVFGPQDVGFLANFLCALEKNLQKDSQHVFDRLLLFPTDSHAYHTINKLGKGHVFNVWWKQQLDERSSTVHVLRIFLAHALLQHGISLLLTDPRAVFFSNPLHDLGSGDYTFDIALLTSTYQLEQYSKGLEVPGFADDSLVVLVSSKRTINFLSAMAATAVLYVWAQEDSFIWWNHVLQVREFRYITVQLLPQSSYTTSYGTASGVGVVLAQTLLSKSAWKEMAGNKLVFYTEKCSMFSKDLDPSTQDQ